MRASFEVRNERYEVEMEKADDPEGEPFERYQVTVRDAEGDQVKGVLKLTDTALAAAEEMAEQKGGSREQWLAQGCSRSLAAEVLIRKLSPDFTFVVDHRWISSS